MFVPLNFPIISLEPVSQLSQKPTVISTAIWGRINIVMKFIHSNIQCVQYIQLDIALPLVLS